MYRYYLLVFTIEKIENDKHFLNYFGAFNKKNFFYLIHINYRRFALFNRNIDGYRQ